MNIFNHYLSAAKSGAHFGYMLSGTYEAVAHLATNGHVDIMSDAHAVTFTAYTIFTLVAYLRGLFGRPNGK